MYRDYKLLIIKSGPIGKLAASPFRSLWIDINIYLWIIVTALNPGAP